MDTIISSPASPRRPLRGAALGASHAIDRTATPRATSRNRTTSRKRSASSTRTTSFSIAAPAIQAPSDQALRRASRLHRDLDQLLDLMGWKAVPAEILSEIIDDLAAFADELKGAYSTVCPYVLRRRQSIDFWVRSAMEGACSVATAREALKVTTLGSPA
jgi:hypothetical protein